MKVQEAYKILGANENTSEEELKKLYKSLVLQNHPDKGGSEEKMKSINEAYNYILEFRKNPRMEQEGLNWGDIFGGGINGFPFSSLFNQQQRGHSHSPPIIDIHISFAESILGCDKSVSYIRFIKCVSCNGEGYFAIDNGCKICNGKGRTTINRGGTVIVQNCPQCRGKINRKSCESCNSSGVKEDKFNGGVSIPAGATNGSRLTMRGMGHFSGTTFFGEAYSDAYIILKVEPNKEMKIDGNDVISTINISLLEALTGFDKVVKTIYGDRVINIKPLAKNKDIIEMRNCGVKNTNGSHKFVLNVEYPKNCEKLIEIMKED